MLEDDVAAFIAGHVMMIAATRDEAMRAHIGRGCGADFDPDVGDLTLLVSATQWPEFCANARPGAPIAFTVCRPDNYKSLQIKGQIIDVREATADQAERGRRYLEGMLAVMADLGVTRLQLSTVLTNADLVAIRFWPADLFLQTPGPGAGERLRSGA
ncbi:hypothetical protein CXZ10_19965 [Pleomorphomonas diazotrophica]|uniref:Pyridoxamine 5'-phosphate oxidase putative domain-containing protein n=1 Tax=Pleomorphomonas diazotrophica TaxID=1166257 RepID=A0A1I4V9V1_9HYPH|nr:hypothetical protein [Pleomorphomonas diazotrophica]PKR87328.1 hypothetical protein CXZ10_19965 [Pleomorphomonas diazotrophica]SFM97931.1 hypothetical protein SAMN05192571_110189 [Pleomorphomonas diazotrophica]